MNTFMNASQYAAVSGNRLIQAFYYGLRKYLVGLIQSVSKSRVPDNYASTQEWTIVYASSRIKSHTHEPEDLEIRGNVPSRVWKRHSTLLSLIANRPGRVNSKRSEDIHNR